MNTVRRYTGRGNNAPQTEPTAQKATQTANSQVETSSPLHNRGFYEQWLDCAKETTTEQLAEYFFDGSGDQIKAINHLLFHWLTTATDLELANEGKDHKRLYTILDLVGFLAQTHDQSLFVASVRADLEAAKQREVKDAK